MRTSVTCLLLLSASVSLAADRFVFLIKPNGDVYQSVVSANNNAPPTPWVSIQADVIILRDSNTPDDPTPVPPVSDPVVARVKELATALKGKNEAIAVAAIVNSLQALNLSGDSFKQALEMAAPIADTTMQANGRVTVFFKAALLVTADPAKLKAGVQAAFNIQASTLSTIHTATMQPSDAALSEEALDFVAIIKIIQMIMELLKSLEVI